MASYLILVFPLSSSDTKERGFSFRYDAPVDMRMNPDEGISAAEFLETAEEAALVRAVRNYGEEPRVRRWSKLSWMLVVLVRCNARSPWPH